MGPQQQQAGQHEEGDQGQDHGVLRQPLAVRRSSVRHGRRSAASACGKRADASVRTAAA